MTGFKYDPKIRDEEKKIEGEGFRGGLKRERMCLEG